MRLGDPLPPRGPAFDPDQPQPGCYRVRLRKGAPDSAIRIWLGYGLDEATGEESRDRPIFWQCELNGAERVALERFWPGCALEPIRREEHDRICERNRTLDPESPFYDPRRPVDLGRAPPPF